MGAKVMNAGVRLFLTLWPESEYADAPHGAFVAAVRVTARQARRILENNNNSNRRLRENVARRYAGLRTSGDWGPNYDPIVIGDNGEVLNGQHRLRSLVISDKADWVIIVFGAPTEAFTKMDRGIRRTPADLLKKSSCYAAVARAVAMLESNEHNVAHEDVEAIVGAYDEAIDWSLSAIRGRGLANQWVRGPFAAAYRNSGMQSSVVQLADDLTSLWAFKPNRFEVANVIAQFVRNNPRSNNFEFMAGVAAGIETHCAGQTRKLLRLGRSDGLPFVMGRV